MKKQQLFLATIVLISLTALTSCTQPKSDDVIVPIKTPDVKVEVVTPPVTVDTNTGTPAPVATTTPQVLTRKETVSYKDPAGDDMIEFDVTVTDGVITAAAATPKAEHEISMKLQTGFSAELSGKVVGKKAKDLQIDAIGGASLTTKAFEQFVHSF